MTTIAYRAGIMAADSLITSYESRHAYTKKIHKVKDCLIGLSGETASCVRFINEFDLDRYITTTNVFNDTFAIVVKGRRIWLYEDGSMIPVDEDTKYVAIGSGTPFALGAMAIGAGPRRAVLAAIKHDINSGGKVQVERL